MFLILVKPSARSHLEAVTLFFDSAADCCATAGDIARAGDTVGVGTVGGTSTRIISVVPDGVATVDFVFPRGPGAPSTRSVRTIPVPVHDNVAAVQVSREWRTGGMTMIWKGAGDRVIKRIGQP